MPLTPEQRSMRARKAALAMHAKHGAAGTERAREGFLARFEAEVQHLPVDQREAAARALLRAHMTGLALRSSIVRQVNAVNGSN